MVRFSSYDSIPIIWIFNQYNFPCHISSPHLPFLFKALSDRISVEILPIDFTDPSAVESARTSVLTALSKQSEGADSVAALGVNLSVAWGNIPEGVPRAILNSVRFAALSEFFLCLFFFFVLINFDCSYYFALYFTRLKDRVYWE